MKKIAVAVTGLFVVLILAAAGYAAKGYFDALRDAKAFKSQADRLIAQGYGPQGLGTGRADMLLTVQDPAFKTHGGVDFSTPGAGATTMSQSLAKRVGFDEFKPGVRKIRQTGYAFGLEQSLSKDQIFTLFLDTVPMGQGPQGWMTGFYDASEKVYQRAPADLSDAEFLRLLAVMIAPSKYNLLSQDTALDERINRIERLVAQKCQPNGWRDVWLDGCATK